MMHSKRNFLVREFFSGSMLNFGGVNLVANNQIIPSDVIYL